MANQILVNPWPLMGVDFTERAEIITGSVALAGSAVATGEPLNWGNLVTGVGYNDTNFVGYGNAQLASGVVINNATALVTTFSASSGTVTATAANNFFSGQRVTFLGNTSVLGLLLNGVTVTVVTATSSQFTFLSSATGTGTSEVGLAVAATQEPLTILSPNGPNLTAPVTAVSASGGIITVTAANSFLPGAAVAFQNPSAGTLVTALANSGITYSVIQSTSTAFTIASTLTGTTGTANAVGFNVPQPYSVDFWSANDSGYNYAYKQSTGCLFAQIGGASASTPNANLSAGAYPAAVLGDIVRYQAWFRRG